MSLFFTEISDFLDMQIREVMMSYTEPSFGDMYDMKGISKLISIAVKCDTCRTVSLFHWSQLQVGQGHSNFILV